MVFKSEAINTIFGETNTWTSAQRGAIVTLTDASTVAVDFSLANNYSLVLGGNRTLGTPTNMGAGQSGVINVYQDITGSRTLAYTWAWQFPGGVAPTLSTAKLALDELSYIVNRATSSVVTITIATPSIITWTAHGLNSGERVQFSNSGGALPTGISAATTYWITVIDTNSFKISTTLANAQAAIFITTSGSQSGVQSATSISITLAANLGVL